MAKLIKQTYKNPLWLDSKKNRLRVEVFQVFDDGVETNSKMIYPSSEDPNSDYQKVISEFTSEYIDKNSEEAIARNAELSKRQEEEEAERRADELRRRTQEELFASKLSAFEIEEIKSSTNRALKAKIRKAKSVFEVQAYATILIMEEMNNVEKVGSTVDTSVNETTTSNESTAGTLEAFEDSGDSTSST